MVGRVVEGWVEGGTCALYLDFIAVVALVWSAGQRPTAAWKASQLDATRSANATRIRTAITVRGARGLGRAGFVIEPN